MIDRIYIICFFALVLCLTISCSENTNGDEPPYIEIDTTRYDFYFGALPPPDLPSDNILTKQKVELGRMLFYEKSLSRDGSQSCASCHRQEHAFTDTTRFSLGIKGLPGNRQAMSIFNMAWNTNEFFWDGRAHLLRDQALLPIQDELEMDETLENVVTKLGQNSKYRDQFIRAFGHDEITTESISLALEQFMLSIVSYDSKYDKWKAGIVNLTPSEERGRLLYETEYNPFFPEMSGADCAHCHGGANFENDRYMNNGLDAEGDFVDFGRENVSGNISDRARFKVPSLRNIALTKPYMHDGRFTTLEEVIDHYNNGIKISNSLDHALLATTETGLLLDEQDKQDLIAFLRTLTDETLITDDQYANPF